MGSVQVIVIAIVVAATLAAFARKALLSLTYAVAILSVYVLQVVAVPAALRMGWGDLLVWNDVVLAYAPGSWPAPTSWITFQFVHGSEAHLLLNTLGFVLLAPIFEERVGSLRWALLFFAGGAAGALVFVLLHANERLILVGASAGLFSVLAAYGRLYPRDRVRLFLPIPGIPALPILQVVIGFLVLESLLGLVGPAGIAWEAHVGGLALGLAAAPAVARLPLGRSMGSRLAFLDELRDLATTPELRSLLEDAGAADRPELREAWVETFVAKARCPKCGGPLLVRLGSLRSDCGWRRRFR